MQVSLTRKAGLAGILTATLALASCAGAADPPAPVVTVPTFTGISAMSSDHSVAVRDLFIPDPGPAGYPAGTMLPLAVQVWNNTNAPVSLTAAAITGGAPATLVEPGSTAAPVATFDLSIKAGSNIGLRQQSGAFLQIQCAKQALAAGIDVPMTFTFSNGATVTADVPIGHFPDPASSAPPVASC